MARLPMTPGAWRLWLDTDFVPPASAGEWQLRHRGPHSLILDLAGADRTLAKLIRPRSRPRDDLRKYSYSQALREHRGAQQLQTLGLATPAMRGWGICVTPFSSFESVLFMRDLAPFTSALTLIREETSRARRLGFLDRFADQLATLYGSGWIHKDCHFDNVCLVDDDRLVWIDTDARRTHRREVRRDGLRKTLRLLETTARGALSAAEWEAFRAHLHAALTRWPDGEYLAHEVS